MLRCRDGSFYTGVTNNVEKRLREHQEGVDPTCYTYKRRPIELVFCETFDSINTAIEKEKQIKGWSRRKKEALIKRNYEFLPVLSKKDFKKRNNDASIRASTSS